MWLDATTRKLQVVLQTNISGGGVQPSFIVAYQDFTTTSLALGTSIGSTNNTTPVDLLAAPGASTQRRVVGISIFNEDALPNKVTVRYNDNGTTYDIVKDFPLSPRQGFFFNDARGWHPSIAPTGRLLRRIYLTGGQPDLETATQFKGDYSPSLDCTTIRALILGAGGGSGAGTFAAGAPAAGAGGGSGAYAEITKAVTPGNPLTYDIGKGGAGGTAGGAGSLGGISRITIGVTTYSSDGGSGGAGMLTGTSLLSSLGGAGGLAGGNADFNAAGEPGGRGQRLGTAAAVGGRGGSAIFGAGGPSRNTNGAGQEGAGYGWGAGGAAAVSSSQVGAQGGHGLIVIEEYG